MFHYSLLGDSNVEGSFYIFFFGGGGTGRFNINVAFRIRKESGYSCLYIHLGWIAQSWLKITQDSAKF